METGVAQTGEGGPTEVDHALDGLATALDHLIKVVEDGGLAAYDERAFVTFLQGLERVRHRTALIDHRVVRDGEARGLPDALAQPGMDAVLTWALRLSRAEARRRVRAAEQLGERVSMTGELLAPLRPALAALQREGGANPEQVDLCLRALDEVDGRGFDPADVAQADVLLAGFAATFPPKELRQLAHQVVDRIDPDGTVPQEQMSEDRRHVALRPLRDGTWALEGRLTGAVGAKVNAVLSPLASPRVERVVLEDGGGVVAEDPRHRGQRMHDAVEEVCDRLLRSGTLPDSGGTPATVVVTIPEADLVARRRWGLAGDGIMLSAEAVRELADGADVWPTVLSATGVVLELGRSRRLASPGQTMALVARDGGCTFPGCERPPEWCERHHVVAWVDGGRTDLDNLTLLCAYHHHNFASRGWTCLMIEGLPAWTPPRWVDPEQRPLHNVRITARQRGGRLRR